MKKCRKKSNKQHTLLPWKLAVSIVSDDSVRLRNKCNIAALGASKLVVLGVENPIACFPPTLKPPVFDSSVYPTTVQIEGNRIKIGLHVLFVPRLAPQLRVWCVGRITVPVQHGACFSATQHALYQTLVAVLARDDNLRSVFATHKGRRCVGMQHH
jgi:hypothetical protein